MAQPSVVIKVKYGDTLRRFSALINENQHLDLDMERLRMKICGLFNFTPDADFILTYVDEDNDQVTLVDNEDLYDVATQGLNPVRISVHLNVDKSAQSSREVTGSSTPRESPSQSSHLNKNPRVTEILKSFPKPLCDALSKLYLELASKASTSTILADFINNLSKVRQSYLNASHNHKNTSTDEGTKPTDMNSQVPMLHAVKGARLKFRSLRHPSLRLRKDEDLNAAHFRNMATMDDSIKMGEEIIEDSNGEYENYVNATTLPTDCRMKDKGIMDFENMGECPFSGVPLLPTSAPITPPIGQTFNKSSNDSSDVISSIFHTGVRCDGCGVIPITGPRFKSKRKHNYDLCSICFNRMGYDSEYIKMDFPLRYMHPWASKHSRDNMFGRLPSMQIPSMMRTPGAKHLHSRYDSRFIMDVNVSDGTVMAPSTPFTKIWRMQNNGTLPWTSGIRLIWTGGYRFNTSDFVEIEILAEGVNVSKEIDIAVDFIAPELPGSYISYWRMALPSGHLFGQRVWVLIQVDAVPENSTRDSPPILNFDLPSPVNVISSAQESPPVIDVNQPAGNIGSLAGESSRVMDLNVDANIDEPTGDVEGDSSSTPRTTASPRVDPAFDLLVEHHKRRIEMEEMNFPINNDLLVATASNDGSSSSSVTSPFRDITREFPVESPISYPEIDSNNQQKPAFNISIPITASSSSSSTPPPFYSVDKPTTYPMSSPFVLHGVDANVQPNKPAGAAKEDDEVSRENNMEETLLKELKEMGFEEVELNKEVLRRNEYDLERSVDEICYIGWDPMLEELKEMGFEDKLTNKKLLVKNNGSLTRVVMDLINGEEQA